MSSPPSEALMTEIIALCTNELAEPQNTKHKLASNLSPMCRLNTTRKFRSQGKGVRFAPRTSEGNALNQPKPTLDESKSEYRAEIARLKDACQVVVRLHTSTLFGEFIYQEDQELLLQYLEHRLKRLQHRLELNEANLKMVALERRLSEIGQCLLRGKNSLNYTPEAWYQRGMDRWESFPLDERVEIKYQMPEVCEALILEKREVKFRFEDLDRRNHLLDAKVKLNHEVEENIDEDVAAAWKRLDDLLELTTSI